MSAWIGIDTYTEFFGNPDSNLQGGVSEDRRNFTIMKLTFIS